MALVGGPPLNIVKTFSLTGLTITPSRSRTRYSPGHEEKRKGNGGLMPKIDGTIMIKVLLKICLFDELNLV